VELRKEIGRIAVFALILIARGRLEAEILNVPADYPTIKSAVNKASDGDTVLVDDGVYLEKNINLSKRLLVRSKNLFGAVIYGSRRSGDSIFIIGAAARVEGFILKSSAIGIEQRYSPDVLWQAANLVVFDCGTGLSINDTGENKGAALVRNVAIFGTPTSIGISTNDADSMDVARCLLVNCNIAFDGYNHRCFVVEDSAVIDCPIGFMENTSHRPITPASSRIERGRHVSVLSSGSFRDPGVLADFLSFLRSSVFMRDTAKSASAKDEAAREAIIALTRAGIMAAMGDYGSAEKGYEAARSAGERAGSREFVWQALMGMARNEESRGTLERAVERYKEAASHIERWIPSVPIGIYRINFLEDKMPAFEALIGPLLDGHKTDLTMGYDEEAFFYAERSKSLSQFFPSRGWGPKRKADPRRARDKATARKEIGALQIRLQDPDLTAEEKEKLVSLLEKAEEGYHGELLVEERAARKEDGPERIDDTLSPLDYKTVRGRLSGRAVLSYVLGQKGSFAFLVTEAGLECARLPPADSFVKMVEPYLRFLQLTDGEQFRGAKAGKILFDLLLGPFAKRLASGIRRIIIIPDDRLRYLPFEALVEAGGGTGMEARFWAESVEISYASSATQALAAPMVSPAGAKSPNILAVGNSDGIRCDNRSRNKKQFFSPLAHVKREIHALTRYFPRRQFSILLDREASERKFKAADLAKYGIIHLATHGVIDDANWWRSALLLRPDALGAEDGFLTALEISELDLEARLVVLSGCGTGVGSLFKGEGIMGLSAAFLKAGADDLLVSLWNVDDKATAVFMGKFYSYLAGGDSPARALARTKLWMIGSGHRDPFYWAPFVLIGRAAAS
jgi:CHAT domain-containing protein